MMRYRVLMALAMVLLGTSVVSAHDLFIKLESYYLEPNTEVTVPILNSSFILSENAIMRDRVIDISLVSAAGRTHIDTTMWSGDTTAVDTTFLQIQTGDPGTYIVGASTKPRELGMSGHDFNEYLAHDGIPDILAARADVDTTNEEVWERYAKHVKAVLQVGDKASKPKTWWRFWGEKNPAYLTRLGYPAEIVPLENPYAMKVGDELSFLILVDGEPVANQNVLLGGEQGGELFEGEIEARSDAEGVVRFVIDKPGNWYVEFIHMAPVETEEDLDYESKWATLAFEMR
ncbi:MAG: DUF4198 domain-containing protein [Gemmatimonadota bacterium]|nr:MAG: DUF4198 domain-containing protein [Gemmatimonadota bacterium]